MSWQAGVRLKVGQDNSWTNFSHCSGLVYLESDGVSVEVTKDVHQQYRFRHHSAGIHDA